MEQEREGQAKRWEKEPRRRDGRGERRRKQRDGRGQEQGVIGGKGVPGERREAHVRSQGRTCRGEKGREREIQGWKGQ